jgi:hypothetical protein
MKGLFQIANPDFIGRQVLGLMHSRARVAAISKIRVTSVTALILLSFLFSGFAVCWSVSGLSAFDPKRTLGVPYFSLALDLVVLGLRQRGP